MEKLRYEMPDTPRAEKPKKREKKTVAVRERTHTTRRKGDDELVGARRESGALE